MDGRDVAAVSCEGVFFSYPGRESAPALHNISLRIRQGEFVALAGANGAGKSTLCKLLNALILPARGRVFSCGLDTSSPQNLASIRARVGLIMHNPDNQIVGPTVEDDVAFSLENLSLARDEMRDRVEEALETMGLVALRRREPHLLSVGERKRLALAGVLAMRPRVLVSDESTSMLDPPTRDEILALFASLKERTGMAVVHATHSPEEIAASDRVLLLGGGRLLYSGSPRDLLNEEGLCREHGLRMPAVYMLAQELERRGHAVGDMALDPKEVAEQLWASR